MRFSILFAALVSASCVVPVEIPHPDSDDGGVDAGTTEDAGSPVDAGSAVDAGFDAGVIPGPCSVPENLGLFLAKTTRRFVFPGCATASFSSEPGVSVVTRPNADGSATVEITPSTIGSWVLTLNANNSMQTRELLTDEQFDFDAGFMRRFPDRVDGALTIMPSGRLVAGVSSNQFGVYNIDGGLEQTIAASPDLFAWAGDAFWTVRPQTTLVERWLDSPNGLVSTGTIDATGYSYCLFCRVEQNQLTSMIGNDVVEFTWDGGSFSRRVMNTGLILPRAFETLVPDGADKVWGDDCCSYEPGCTTTVCAAIRTCVRGPGGAQLVYANDTHALVYNGSGPAIQLWSWPLSTGRELHGRSGVATNFNRSKSGPIRLGPSTEAVIHRNRVLFRGFGVSERLIITEHWVVRFLSPRELQFIPR